MPFTASHAALAIPAYRAFRPHAVPSAVVIGTMAPDFWYFAPMLDRLETHSVISLLWFSLPIGMVAYSVFHKLVKIPLMALLPAFVRRRTTGLAPLPASRPLAVAASVLVGATSHL